jgi:hypothetical protein
MLGSVALLALVALAPAGNAATAYASGYGNCVRHGYLTNGVYLWTLTTSYSASASYGVLEVLANANVHGTATYASYQSVSSSWLSHPTGDSISVGDSGSNVNAHFGDGWSYSASASVSGLGVLSSAIDSDSNNGFCLP